MNTVRTGKQESICISQLLCVAADIADISNTLPFLIMTPCNACLCPMHQESLPSKHGSYLNVMLKTIIILTTISPSKGGNPIAVIVTKCKGRTRNKWTKLNLHLQDCETITRKIRIIWAKIQLLFENIRFFVCGVITFRAGSKDQKHHKTSSKLKPLCVCMCEIVHFRHCTNYK